MKHSLLIFGLFLVFASCKKSTTTPVVKEENIVFETNAGLNAISTSGTFAFQVTLKSKMPTGGIKIEVSAIEEAGGAAVTPQPNPITSSTAVTDYSVQNLARQKWVVATVKVSSVTTPTNSSSQTFRVIYK